MKVRIKIALIAVIAMFHNINGQDKIINGKLTIKGEATDANFSLESKGVRHSIFNYHKNSNFYFGAGRGSDGIKKEMIFYNYSCQGGCNVPRISFLTDVLYTPGNIGVGTKHPKLPLVVNGSAKIGDDNWGALFIDGKGNNNWLLNAHSDSNSFYIRSQRDNSPESSGCFFTIKRSTGNVGIGTATPKQTLDVNGSVKIGNDNWGGVFIDGKGNNNWLLNAHDDSDSFHIRSQRDNSPVSSGYFFTIKRSTGNIGVGTTDPKGYKLAVAGKAVAEEITVKLKSNWPDYVFNEDYNLPTLKEVEKQIKEKGHLKNIPTAKEVKENGIELGEMNKKLLQKIEELTLYTIQQEKRLQKLEKLIKKQSKILNKTN